MAWQFFDRVIEEARRRKLLPPDHFTVDGTLLEAWASIKSFRPKDEAGPGAVGKNPEVDFRGKPRRNDSHASTTDPEARLARRSTRWCGGSVIKLLATGSYRSRLAQARIDLCVQRAELGHGKFEFFGYS